MRIHSSALMLATILLCGCDGVHQQNRYPYTGKAVCSQITQSLDQGFRNNTPSSRTINTADEAHLLKMYNYMGCHSSSDNRYTYPNQSLKINAKLNNTPAHEKDAISFYPSSNRQAYSKKVLSKKQISALSHYYRLQPARTQQHQIAHAKNINFALPAGVF